MSFKGGKKQQQTKVERYIIKSSLESLESIQIRE